MQYKKIYVFHEYGIPEHYKGLVDYAKVNDIEINFNEFRVIKDFVKSIVKLDRMLLIKTIKNIKFFIKYFLFPVYLKNQLIVVGCAPLDWRIIFLSRVISKSTNIYHSSWHDWSGSFYPIKNIFGLNLENKWKEIINSKFDAIAAVTPNTKDSLKENFKIDKLPIEVVYHAFEDEIFRASTAVFNKSTSIRVIFVGRLVKDKGVELISFLAKELPMVSFTVVGEGSLYEMLQSEANEISNMEVLPFIKNRHKLSSLLSEHDIILQPSIRSENWEELFGMALVEAMACGLVPIATDHSGPKTILSGSQLAPNLISETGCTNSLKNNLKEIILSYQLDVNKLKIDSQHAIEIARDYNIDSIRNKWDSLINKICY